MLKDALKLAVDPFLSEFEFKRVILTDTKRELETCRCKCVGGQFIREG